MTEHSPGSPDDAAPPGDSGSRRPASDAKEAYVAVLFNRHRGALHRYLSRLVAKDEIADLVQETYVRVLRHEQLVHIDALARALLFQTATNLARDHRRRRLTREAEQPLPIPESERSGFVGSPEESLAGEQALAIIERTLAQLPADMRTVFVLSRFKELSYPEIAVSMGLSQRTVARKMAEALDALAMALESAR